MNSCGSAVGGTALIGDIAVVLILFISFIIGTKKGFIGLVVTFLAGILTFVLATLLCEPVAELLGTSFGLRATFEEVFADIFSAEAFTKPLSELAEDNVAGLLASLNLPEFITAAFEDLLLQKIADASIPQGVTIQSVLASSLAGIALSAIAWVILFALFSIIFLFVKKFIKIFNKIPIIGSVNKLLGGLLCLIIAAAVICILMYLFSLLGTALPEAAVEYVKSTRILCWLYDNNPIAQLITSLFAK